MIDLRPAAGRFHTRIDWLDSWHSFSFGGHYDPTNMGHGLLLVNNDDRVAPAFGFGTHAHRDMEIVTWVLSGELEHHDSEGHQGRLHPGLAQRMSAGTGIAHSEMNPNRSTEVHFLQMWVLPDRDGISPGYEQRDVTDELATGELVKVASGNGDAAIHIHQADAAMWVARLESPATITVPPSPKAHVFVAQGDGWLDGDGADRLLLAEGDAVRLSDGASPTFTADGAGAEIVIWTTV